MFLKAIGRVIRHKMDYGAILLCDQRFGSPDIIQQLSAWVRPRVQNFPKIGPLLRDLGIFFRNNEIVFPGSTKAVRAPVPVDSSREDYKKSRSTVDSFHHALSSGSSRVVPQNHPKANRPLQESYQVDLSGYSSISRPVVTKETTIFDDSEVSAKVIDFNETESSALPCDMNVKAEVCQPVVKKRKLTIVSDAEKAKYDRRRLKEAAEGPCTSSSDSSQPQVNIVNIKKETAAEYLKNVKSQLQPVHYTTFYDMIKSYRSEKNYDILLSTLKKLFLQDPKLRHLFKG